MANSALPPSATLVSPIVTVGAVSSSVMVPVPVDGEPSVALAGDARVTAKVSSPSTTVSSVVCTSMVALVDPAAMVAVRAVVTAV